MKVKNAAELETMKVKNAELEMLQLPGYPGLLAGMSFGESRLVCARLKDGAWGSRVGRCAGSWLGVRALSEGAAP